MDIEFDDQGWAAIHHCMSAEKELLKSIENFITINEDNLEVETRDSFRRTPLLLAVYYNKKKSVDKLINLGANIRAVDNYNHGVVEICINNENMGMLHHLMDKECDSFNVWDKLVSYVDLSTNEESEKVTRMVNKITLDPHALGAESECTDKHWQQLVRAGGIPALIKQCKTTSSNTVKINIMNTLKNIVTCEGVCTAIVDAGGIGLMLELLRSGTKPAVNLAAACIQEITSFSQEYSIQVHRDGFLGDSMKLLQNSRLGQDTITNIITTIGHVASSSSDARKVVGSTPKLFDYLLSVFKKQENRSCIPLLTASTDTIGRIIKDSTENQNLAVDEGVAEYLLLMSRANKYRELQLCAIKVLHSLTSENRYAVSQVVNEGGVAILMNLLKRGRGITLQEAVARTLWSLAGPRTGDKYSLASVIGADLLIEFLGAQGEISDSLNCIGCDGLATLAYGSFRKLRDATEDSGVIALVRLLRSSNIGVLTSALRALRFLCLRVGYIPNLKNQALVASTRGLRLLVTLLAHSSSEEIQVEAALAIAAAVSGHAEVSAQLKENSNFSYLLVIRLFYSEKKIVRLYAGNALAMFCYNSAMLQQEISEYGGIRWHNFTEFLTSSNDLHALHAAFQVVIMARIIPDEEPATSVATAMSILVGILERSDGEDAAALAADCVARLAHSRAGIPSALVAVNAVYHLFKLLESDSEQVRGSAAIALGYLSFDHNAERQMLGLCRKKPNLVHVIKYYTKLYKLSPSFIEGWRHSVKLSSIETKKTEMLKNLSGGFSKHFMNEPKMPSTPLTGLIEEVGRQESGLMQRSRNQIFAKDDGSQIQGRSSHSSRITLGSTISPNRLPVQAHLEKPSSSILND